MVHRRTRRHTAWLMYRLYHGSRLLLTANHSIQFNADGTAGWVRFRPAYYNGSAPFGEAWATQVIWWMQTTGGNGLTDQETAFDYVVCVLDSRMGDTVGFQAIAPTTIVGTEEASGNTWGTLAIYQVGNVQHFKGTALFPPWGTRALLDKPVLSWVTLTTQSAGIQVGQFGAGDAGEPWPRVVGTQSAEASVPANNTSGDNEFGGGPALSSLITWARSGFPMRSTE